MSQQRAHPQRARSPQAAVLTTTSPLLSSSTITFLASWRGQLLICTVVLILGGIYFVLQEPISTLRRRRREALSRVREEELMSMETVPVEKEVVEEVKEKRGREKKKDVRKRKGSLLKIPNLGSESSATGPSSIESSPAPHRTTFPVPKMRSSPYKGKSPALPRISSADAIDIAGDTQIPAPQLTLSPPALIIEKHNDSSSGPTLMAPWEIPLPVSPVAGPSRLNGIAADSDLESVDGDGGNTTDSIHSNLVNGGQSGSDTRQNKLSEGFSIIPEDGYLPDPLPQSSKKKKRKGRAAPPPALPTLDRRPTRDVTDVTPQTPGKSSVPASPMTQARRARQASLTRPANADLADLLTEREKMIETLRAEIGVAKAEEAKAREEASRGRATEERLKGDVERARKINQRTESEARKRESELNARLSQLSSHYTVALHRLGTLEVILRETGQQPPSSPAVPGLGQIPPPISLQHMQHQQVPSPIPVPSPYAMNFGPSPRQISPMGLVPYPSPGMYPSPMLHPHFHPGNSHSHSPSPFRRASASGITDESGHTGPFTPGQPLGSGSYPFDLGIMPLESPAISLPRQPSPNGQLTAADLRRISIESSVLKKKAKERSGSESGDDDSTHQEPLPGIEEVRGLGVGEIEGVEGGFSRIRNGHSHLGEEGSADSHPSSPSPPNRASMLLTPASADLFHRALVVNGSSTPEVFTGSRNGSDVDFEGIKVIQDAENGNLYFRHTEGSSSRSGSESRSDADEAPEAENGTEGEEAKEITPMFASLAHTPQQLAEIQKMREQALKARERSVDGRGRGVNVGSAPVIRNASE